MEIRMKGIMKIRNNNKNTYKVGKNEGMDILEKKR